MIKGGKRMKRLLALSMVFALLFSVVTGCGSTSDDGSSTAEIELSEPGTYPLVKDKITFRAVVATGPFVEDMKTNDFTKWYEEKTNIHIEWNTISEQGMADKVSVLLAGGDLPDFFMNASVADMEVKYGTQEGTIIPVDEYIKNDMRYIHESITGAQLDSLKQLDGRIYGLPIYTDCFHCSAAAKMWINKKWVDKLGLSMPTTTEEFVDVLRAFKTGDPNGNGKADELPLVGAIKGGWHNTVDKFIMNSFLFYNLNLDPDIDIGHQDNGGWLVTDDKKIDTTVNKDAYREGLRYLNMLYKEGLIYDGSFTQDNQQLIQVVENPGAEVVGAVPGGWGGTFCKVPGERYNDYVTIAPLKGPDGTQNAATFPQLPYNALWITKECKYPQLVARWADWFYSQEGTLSVRRGLEGTNWRWPTEGETGINGQPAVWTQLVPWNDSEPQNNFWVRLGVYSESDPLRLGQTIDTTLDRHSMDGLELFLYEETKNNYQPYMQYEKAMPPLKFTDAQMTDLSTIKVEYGKYVRQWNVEFITGKKNLDTDWDAYLKGLSSVGLETLLEEFNKSYEAIYKK